MHKRLKLLNQNDQFYYHVDNDCYKSYTLKKSLEQIQKSKEKTVCPESGSCEEPQAECSQVNRSLRSKSTERPEPSPTQDSDNLPCIVCNHVRTSESGTKVKKKFRICEEQRANKFLAAASFFQDEVFHRIADIDSEQRIFAADLFSF